jgi:hypothetical protein
VARGLAPCTNDFGRERLRSAEAFIRAAERVLSDDEIIPGAEGFKNNAAINNYVHAGIAAADAVCCFELKAHSLGDDHRQAIAQLRRVKPDGPKLGQYLGVLLDLKTKAGYGSKPLSDTAAKRAERAAVALVQAGRARRP